MKFKLQLGSLFINIIEILCLCTPLCFNREFWEIINGFGSSHLAYTYGMGIFEIDSSICIIIAIIIFVLLAISAICQLISIIKRKSLSKEIFISNIASFIMLIVYTILAYNLTVEVNGGYREYSIGWMFYIIVATHIINIIISSIVKQNKFVDITKKEKISDANELKKFKELLDMGAITQEEY